MPPTYWSCLSKEVPGQDVAVYDDVIESRYAYDQRVPHATQIAVGDVLVIRDAYQIRGYGAVERIDSEPGVKLVQQCPDCHRAQVSAPRKRAEYRYRCQRCGHEFDQPVIVPTAVTRSVAHYGSTWAALGAVVPTGALARDGVYAEADQRNAIRRLDSAAAWEFLNAYVDVESALNLAVLVQMGVLPGGRRDAVVKVRKGQAQFREALFERFGSVCAVTGRQPADVLDAAHLYSFAERPEHHRDGGLLLRSDVHRLFDRLFITFDPVTWSSKVAPPLLRQYESLRPLDGLPIAVPEESRPDRSLVADHYEAARARWRNLDRASR
ncbi:MAG TPA: HNH endonuclease signature motif containing protein [Cellulomonas sp.]